MARKRMINPTIWDDPNFVSMTNTAKLLFIGLFSNADDEGRIRGNPAYLKKTIFGYDNTSVKQVEKLRNEVVDKMKNVMLYENKEEEFIALLEWGTHQKLRGDRIQPSDLPAPPKEISNYDILKTVEGENEPLKIQITKRDKGCRYCGIKFPDLSQTWIMEHIIPKSKGGETNLENCVLACQRCNSKKSNKTLEEAKMELIPLPANKCGQVRRIDGQVRQVEAEDRLGKDRLGKDSKGDKSPSNAVALQENKPVNDIAFVFSIFKRHFGISPKPIKAKNGNFDLNAAAAKRLVKVHTRPVLEKMLDFTLAYQKTDKYCRISTSPLEFEKNYTWYKTYFEQKKITVQSKKSLKAF